MPDLQEIANAVNKMYRDLYQGEGRENPSITTRLYDLEQTIKDFRIVKWLLVGAIVTGAADMIFSHIKL